MMKLRKGGVSRKKKCRSGTLELPHCCRCSVSRLVGLESTV